MISFRLLIVCLNAISSVVALTVIVISIRIRIIMVIRIIIVITLLILIIITQTTLGIDVPFFMLDPKLLRRIVVGRIWDALRSPPGSVSSGVLAL